MRLGVVGGTFDPIHYGHLVAAEECRARLNLDRVLFVPAGHPPHKRARPITSSVHRVAMVELAIADNPAFQLSRIEVDRPGYSYTVETLERLRCAAGSDCELYFVVGMDALAEILTWYEPARIVELARVVAVTRPGYEAFDPNSLEPTIPNAGERITLLPAPELRISSTDLRARVRQGLPIRYQVPPAVEAYVAEHGLYAPSAGSELPGDLAV